MSNGWKAFFHTLFGVLASIATAGLYLLLRRPGGRTSISTPTPTPATIAKEVEEEVLAVRQEIAQDTDAELAARFNRLAKKEKKP